MFLSICIVFSLIPVSAQADSKPKIQIGDYVKMGTYNDNSILWRCVDFDDNGLLMLADKIVDTLAYDAKTKICVPGLIQQQRLAKQSLCRLCSK